MNVYLYVLVMAVVTYLVRMLPFVLFRKEIKSTFVRSFLYYVPYAVLGAMTVPWIFYATDSFITAAVGFVAALIASLKERSLLVVAAVACISALAAGGVLSLLM